MAAGGDDPFTRYYIACVLGLRDYVDKNGFPQRPALIGTLFFVQAGMSAVTPVLPLFVGELTGNEEGVATLAGVITATPQAPGTAAASPVATPAGMR